MHHHGYTWVGEKKTFDRESIRRPPGEAPTANSEKEVFDRYREAVAEFPVSGVPPIQTAHWLLKPPSIIRGTWEEPKEAGAWLRLQLAGFASRFASADEREPDRLALLERAVVGRLTWGGDVSLGHYLNGTAFHAVALVTCSPNRAAPGLSCPVARSRA
ncbi:hypothetical protein I3J09_06710 [Streptomyces clavuligerus]|uniref:Uncharacterized protein n=1 Tax=Streptomyces clavuligerus TaxID=1901 RepID=B5H0P0_STRCL|nr:hypothetical protein [Streptomyces clavuligerus]ANW17921.1 hypothetical protein BB341_06655 [Streptomyces clavuligerus]AXU12478.1 hypothetical protein D1794_06910 [Streptomyces clavuligerus]EDY52136.1 hypothetical protein SSCG_05273 [Streptomyces clavuligerus]EFG09521.1 Hypothetical protein SCLAV_4450 [Streptomyces clavuligerus]MBY6302369.1 hypothetical protein [Streptomyces clavuligerus]